MTSTDAAAPAAEAVVEPAPADAKSADADGASAKAKDSKDAGAPIKEVPKPDQPRLPKPDRRDLDKAVAELQEECDAKQARIEELKRAIETRRDARKTVGAGSASTKTRIQELNQQFQARMDERNAIRKELMALDATRERLREQAGAMKSKLRFTSVDAVEKEMARLEDAIAHTTVSLNEEKKMVAQIKELGKSKELVRAYAEAQSKITGDDGSRKAVIDRLKAKDGEIDAVKAEQTSLRGALTETKKKEDKAVSDVPKLNDERNALYETIKANREKIRALRDAHKKKEDAYYERERLWRAYLKVEKQKQWEAGLEERKAREAAKKQWELENAPEPFEAEVTAAEQLIAYLAKWNTGASEEKKAEEAKRAADEAARAEARRAAAEKAEAAFAGMSLVTKKAPDENVFGLSSGVGARGKKGKKFGKKPAGSGGVGATDVIEQTVAAPRNERLQIPFDAYGGFAKLSVAVPTMTGDVPATVAALRLKKAEFLEKRRVKKERAAAGLEDEDEKREKEAAKAERRGRGEKKERGRARRGAVSVTLEVVDEAVTCVISVPEKSEKAEK